MMSGEFYLDGSEFLYRLYENRFYVSACAGMWELLGGGICLRSEFDGPKPSASPTVEPRTPTEFYEFRLFVTFATTQVTPFHRQSQSISAPHPGLRHSAQYCFSAITNSSGIECLYCEMCWRRCASHR